MRSVPLHLFGVGGRSSTILRSLEAALAANLIESPACQSQRLWLLQGLSPWVLYFSHSPRTRLPTARPLDLGPQKPPPLAGTLSFHAAGDPLWPSRERLTTEEGTTDAEPMAMTAGGGER